MVKLPGNFKYLALAALCFVFAVGCVGGMECGTMADLPATVGMFGGVAGAALFGWLGGAFR